MSAIVSLVCTVGLMFHADNEFKKQMYSCDDQILANVVVVLSERTRVVLAQLANDNYSRVMFRTAIYYSRARIVASGSDGATKSHVSCVASFSTKMIKTSQRVLP